MKKVILIFSWILVWKATWDVQKYCAGYYDFVRGENRPESERMWCRESVFSWRTKQFDTREEMITFRDDDLISSPGTVVTDISFFESTGTIKK